jgi:alanine racemase
MDQSFVDVTGIDCRIGDEVTLLGESACGAALTLEELKRLTGQTLTYPLTMINSRVARVYKY